MGKPLAADPSTVKPSDSSKTLEAMRAFAAANPPKADVPASSPKPAVTAPMAAKAPAPVPASGTAGPSLKAPSASEVAPVPTASAPVPATSAPVVYGPVDAPANHLKPKDETWVEWADRVSHAPFESINPADSTYRAELAKKRVEHEKRVEAAAIWRAGAEDEKRVLEKQLAIDGDKYPINMIDLDDRYGVDVNALRQDIAHHLLAVRSSKEYPGHKFDNVDVAMSAAGVKDPDEVKKQWAKEATDEAATRVKQVFAGKKHLVAISVDNEGLMKELSEYNQVPIMERTRIPISNAPLIPIPWSTADIMAITAPKTWSVSVPGGVNSQLTTGEIKGEEWGDYIPRVAFDLTQAAIAARHLTFMEKGGKDIAATALPTIVQDGTLGDHIPKWLREVTPLNPAWRIPMFTKAVDDGDVKRAYEVFVEASAAANGYGRTQEEKEEYITLLRTNPAFRDILQKEWVSLFTETYNSLYPKETALPEWLRMSVSAGGYVNGMVLGDFVIPDPVAIFTAGTGALFSESYHLHKLRQADKLVENTARLVEDAATTPEMLRAANTLISPAMADHQFDVVTMVSRTEDNTVVGVKALETEAQKLLDEAVALQKSAQEAPAETAEAVKKVGEKTKAAVEETEFWGRDKAAKLKDAHAETVKAAKLAEAERKIAEASDILEKTELIRTEQAVADSRKALDEYATNNDPLKKIVDKAYREATALEGKYQEAQKAAKEFARANADDIEVAAAVYVEEMSKIEKVQEIAQEAKKLTQDKTRLQAHMQHILDANAGKSMPASVKKELKTVAQQIVEMGKRERELEAAAKVAKEAAAPGKALLQTLTPQQKAVWKKLISLQDNAADISARVATNEDTLHRLFGEAVPDTLLAADKAMRKQLVGSYEAARAAHKAQVEKAGGTAKALAKAEQGRKQAAAATSAARAARVAASDKTVAKVAGVAAKGRAAAAEAAVAGKTREAARAAAATDRTVKAQSVGKQAGAWRQAALDAAEKYRTGLRMAPRMRALAADTRTTKKLITQGLLKETSNKAGFLVDVPTLLKRMRENIGEGGVKWLSEQTTDTGRTVKKLTEAIGGLQLSPQEVRALEQGVESYNAARVMGHGEKDAILTFNTVKGLEAIEHTKSTNSWMKKGTNWLAKLSRAFEPGAIELGTINDTLPGIARAASNKGAQAKDELAYIKTRGKWSNVSDEGKEGVKKLGINADADAEGATQAALIIEYLNTTKPIVYGPGGTLLNTSTITGKSLFEQFRIQANNDARISEFLARARVLEKEVDEAADEATIKAANDAYDKLLADYTDTTAPYLLGVARVWFPSNPQRINPKTAHKILEWMMEELRDGAERGDDMVTFVVNLRERTAKLPNVGVVKVVDGVETATTTTMRHTSQAGVGGSDKDVVRVLGFLGDLVAHGSNLYETEHLLTKAMGGVIDVDTMRHVDAFLSGEFKGLDGKPIDVSKVMEFFNRMGMPMTSDRTIMKDWAGKVGDRVVKIAALQRDPEVATWVTGQLVKSLDADLGKVVKTLEGRTLTDGVPDMGGAARLVNLWRRSVTVGLIAPRPSFWMGNYLGNITQTWTTLGPGKAAQVAINDSFTNFPIPFMGKWAQDYLSKKALAARGRPVLGPVMDWMFNPHISAVMNGEKGWIKMKNGAVIDYDTLRREAIEQGVVDTMLREDLSTVFARRAQKGWGNKISRVLWAETDYHRAVSDFQTMTQQRSRMSLYLRLRDEGHPAGEAGRMLNDALFDWKHGAPAIGWMMQLLPFWRFFSLGHRQAFRAEMQGFYDVKGAMRGLVGDSQMGHIRQQRATVQAIEELFLPEQQGPYATKEEQELAKAANLDPAWNHDKIRFGLTELPDSVRRKIMEDSGTDKSHAMYSLWKPTTVSFMDTHFGFMAAVTAEAYAGAYGGNVEARGMAAMGETISSSVDDTVPYLAGPLHAALNSVGLDPMDGHTSESVWASDAEVEIIETLGKSMGMDTSLIIWRPEDAGGRARMTAGAAMLSQLPYANEIIPNYARIALSPYGLEKDDRALKMVTYATTKSLGFGPVFFNPADTIGYAQSDTSRGLGRIVPPGMGPQHRGRVNTEEPPLVDDEEVDTKKGPR